MKSKKVYLKVKDFSVSGEEFQLIENNVFGFLETFPQPNEEQLPEYYKTEDYISHTDSKRNLFEKVYHLVRAISLKRKLKLINSFRLENKPEANFTNKKLLDIGCGTGDFLETAKNDSWNIFGIEPNKQARDIANKKTKNAVFNVEQLLEFEKNSFDVITLWHVLEHLPNLEKQISNLQELLKPEGTLVIAVPNYKSYDALYYKKFWAAFDVPRHLWHFSQESISNLISKKDMKVVKTLPMIFDSYYVSMLSEKYKNGWLNIFNAVRVGWLSNNKAKRSGEYSSLIYVIKNR
ncbi:class I SAM-dependent methyltransferase [Xanthomarina sp. F1114]|uniref:class I SAM-dependent methyltransferase n=1 Tax=Xanthomarina sp. F1114 TaxID=2996019 RepID=UPI00225E419B|nr:class I SAM-dependent methyltransferase [Xanthomarina sp. F1114]MCX7546585.1 class I SAM-dependent methyltransferase [Xanthomarina sp. F1114]